MQQFELRVHIAAPSMVRNDTRWMKIADNIVKFKPARRLYLNDSIVEHTCEHSQENGLCESSDSTHAISASSGLPPTPPSWVCHDSDPEYVQPVVSAQGRPRAGKRLFAEPIVDSNNAKRTKRTTFARAKKGLNPAFKNPSMGYLKTGQEAKETPRPRTAPQTTVLVPFTTSPKTRRSLSESASLLTARGCDGFAEPVSNSRVDETSFMDESPEASDSLEVRQLLNPSPGSENNSFEMHRYPANQEQLLPAQDAQDEFHTEADMTRRLSQTSFRESVLEMGTGRISYEASAADMHSENCFSKGKLIATSTPSTETGTDSTQYFNNSSPLVRRSAAVLAPVIDLTADGEESVPQVTRRDVLGSVSSPLPYYCPSPVPPESSFSNSTHLAAIHGLSQRVRCHVSNSVTSKPFTTTVSDYLQNLADKFDLVNHFQPVRAPALIRNIERGYWKLLFKIADLGAVAKARRSPLSNSQWSDRRFMLRQEGQVAEPASTSEGDATLKALMYPYIDPGTATPWTVEEFTEFWDYLGKVIERGRAGYDVFATIKSCEGRRGDGLLVEARLYGWAETLSHLWLVLYGVSNGLTARMPLQWFGPGEGALVTMSGQPKRGGSIGRWVEQKSGADGHWGPEKMWEGLDVDLPASRQSC